jgi:hypothetical protein
MKLGMSVFVDAFQGSGVPVAGDPITSVQNVSLLELRTTTVLDNCNPQVSGVVKARFIATNCGAKRIELISPCRGNRHQDDRYSEDNLISLLPGESFECSIFRSWDAPGEYQLAMAYEARCAGQPFARLTFPPVAIHVRPAENNLIMQWLLWAGAVHPQAR